MHPIQVAKLSFYGNCALVGLMIAFDTETAALFGVMNMQVMWAALGSMMLGVFLNMIILLHKVLVVGETRLLNYLNVSSVLRESELYQMEAIE